MYLAADLTGVDLRDQDVSFLVGLGTNFEGAILTDQQRRQLRSGREKERREESRRTIRDLRIEMILRFIERYGNADISPYSDPDRSRVPHDPESMTGFETLLREVLLEPLLRSPGGSPANQFGSDYMSSVLLRLHSHLDLQSLPFFKELFKLLGDIHAPVDNAVIDVLKAHYQSLLANELGALLAEMRPTQVLDSWWILDQDGFQVMISTAVRLSRHRKVHAVAIESFATEVDDPVIALRMLTEAQYDIGADQAERIAYAIISKKWPASMVPDLLDARVPRPLQNAFFRQLLAQGNSARVVEVVRWLDQDRGAVGALSLENAIRAINDFTDLYRLGKALRPNLRGSQLEVFKQRLTHLAVTDEERAQARRLR